MGNSACVATLTMIVSIYMFHNLSEYIKHTAVGFLDADDHTTHGSLQMKRSNQVAFLH